MPPWPAALTCAPRGRYICAGFSVLVAVLGAWVVRALELNARNGAFDNLFRQRKYKLLVAGDALALCPELF